VTTFVLIHGAWHDGWCWHLVGRELERRGHRVVTPDLPVDDPQAGIARYADAVDRALADAGDGKPGDGAGVVVVGHSFGGLITPVVAAGLGSRARAMVFVAALLPTPGASYDETAEPGAVLRRPPGSTVKYPGGGLEWKPGAAREVFYPDVPEELAGQAVARLRRQYWRVSAEKCPLRTWPEVESTVIGCAADAVIGPEWVSEVARRRLGTEAVVLPGGHSPFLSRPAELAGLLLGTAR
jgi:pimeloyl-ACP methyl ester carboxylesterase